MQLKDLFIGNSQIPKRYLKDVKLIPAKVDEKAFMDLGNIRDHISEFVKGGSNLLICSNNVGNGKTTFAVKLLMAYIDSLGSKAFKDMTPALFINVSNFLNEKKLAISNPDIQAHVADIESKIMTAQLVVFDDLGVKDLSQYDMGNLYYWIDYRTSNMKSCIYTSNLVPWQLKKALDDRIYSRVVNYSTVIEIKDGDSRGVKQW